MLHLQQLQSVTVFHRSIWNRYLRALEKQELSRVKGPQGGYLLAKPATKISVAEILRALEGDYLIEEEDVEGAENGRAAAQAVQSEVIERLNRGLQDILENLFLSDLEQKYQEYSEYSQDMYYI